MSNRAKIILIIVIGLLIIAGILFFFLNGREASDPKDETAPAAKVEPVKEEEIKVAPVLPQEKVASSLKAVAVTFAERFGSFSNQSDYLNLKELAPLMTDKMSSWVNTSYIPKLMKDFSPSGFFYQISTQAPVSVVLGQTASTAKIKLSTQRREKKADQTENEFLQDLILDLIKLGENWLVDAAYWQAKK